MNSEQFLANQHLYFSGAYDQFCAFGGPCVYFHRECLRAQEQEFLSSRHVEMLYATLTAWGMHRMGGTATMKTKLTDWTQFRDSLIVNADTLRAFRSCKLVDVSESEYSDVVESLRPTYFRLKLSVSGATIVVNSKALYHVFPDLIPPIDRQYTVRFFTQPPETWRTASGKFAPIQLPTGGDAQFRLFHRICVDVKRLADRVDRQLLDAESHKRGVTAPKAIDNAIVNYVRIVSGNTVPAT